MNRDRVTWGCSLSWGLFLNESRWKSRSDFHRLWTRVTWRERVVCRVPVLEHLEKFYCDDLYNIDGNNFDKFILVELVLMISIVAWGKKLGWIGCCCWWFQCFSDWWWIWHYWCWWLSKYSCLGVNKVRLRAVVRVSQLTGRERAFKF